MITIRPALKWIQALAALLLLAGMPGADPSRIEGGALSHIGDDVAKTIPVHRQQPGTRTEAQPERFDDDGDPDAALAPNSTAPARSFVIHACTIEANEPRFPRFCGASPRAPPSA